MKVFRLDNRTSSVKEQVETSVTAVGFFDGVHTGHRKVMMKAKGIAEKEGRKWGVMTFDPHPSVVLKGVENAQYLTPLPVKEKLIEELGADYLFIVPFTKELASLSPQTFVDEYFAGLCIAHVVAGFDFSFGHKGKGNMEIIDQLADGRFTSSTVEEFQEDSEKVSSTRIRKLLDEGEVIAANELLGRSYVIYAKPAGAGELEIPLYYHHPEDGEYEAEVDGERGKVMVKGSRIEWKDGRNKSNGDVPVRFLKELRK
ncbi:MULTISPECIES: FAD synthetase family protein [Salimicrobium]|uniref:FAD synthase n=2 Tax=Salimicrobium TaxID=351195 RepID=A0ABY1KTT4_9BACI|nr:MULTISPECIES: FAD synthetase family protein [Salimicrobium]SDX30096.1 riboflavin kinase / FMN adenylyltransferase [Salimicrobium album]SIS64353.1 riboflavin kinase / FMN adenylyltransferase [Salimicrobium salexigens]